MGGDLKRSRGLISETLQTAQIKNGDSYCLLLKRKMGHLFYPFVKKKTQNNNNPIRPLLQSCCALEMWILLVFSTEEALFFQKSRIAICSQRETLRNIILHKSGDANLILLTSQLLSDIQLHLVVLIRSHCYGIELSFVGVC